MDVHTAIFSYNDAFALLDDEFDKLESAPVAAPLEGHHRSSPVVDDLAWDDQLDNGQEMSL